MQKLVWRLEGFERIWIAVNENLPCCMPWDRQFFLNTFFYLDLSALNTTCNNIDEFECGNGDCIKYTLTCDGTAHCKDKSDEKQSYCGEWNVFLCQNIFSQALVADICNLSPFHFLCGSQSTVCVRRVTGSVWMAAVWGTAPGAMGKTTVETILMNSSVTVSRVSGLNKFLFACSHMKF